MKTNCPIDLAARVPSQLPSIVREAGGEAKRVTNLGWLLRHWKDVERFDVYAHPPVASGFPSDAYLVARLRDGRTYETGYACAEILRSFLDRPVFRGLPVSGLSELIAAASR